MDEISIIFRQTMTPLMRRRNIRNILFDLLMSGFNDVIANHPVNDPVEDKLTEEQFNNLPKLSLDELKEKNKINESLEDNELKCFICRESYTSTDEIIELPCEAHHYHRDCIHEWTTNHHSNCPLCRKNIL